MPNRSRDSVGVRAGSTLALWSLLAAGAGSVAGAALPAGWWTGLGPADELAGRRLFAEISGAGAGGRLFVATDGGAWRGGASGWRRSLASPAFVPAWVVTSPTRPELVLGITNLFAPTLHPRQLTFRAFVTGFVEVSRDGGDTFERCVAEAPLPTLGGKWLGENRAIAAVAFDPDAASTVFLATGDGLLRLDLERCPEVELLDARGVYDVIATRGGAGTILLTASRDSISDLRRSGDGGASWGLAIPDGPQRARRWALATDPRDAGVAWALAGTSPDDLFGNKDLRLELWRSERNGRSWLRRAVLPLRGVPDDLGVDSAGRLFASVDAPDGWHLVRSLDGGGSWLEATPAATTEPARLAIWGSGLVWSSGGRLYESSDGGESWSELEPPRVPAAGRTLVTGQQIVVLEPAELVSPDGGVTWQEAEVTLAEGLVAADFVSLRRSSRSGVVYATPAPGAHDVRVLASEDGGLSWSIALEGAPTFGSLAVAASGATREQDVLVWVQPCSGACHPEFDGLPAETGQVMRSNDGGESWVEVSMPFLALLSDVDARVVGGTTVIAAVGSGFLGFPTRADFFWLSLDGGVSFSAPLPLPSLAGALVWVRLLDLRGELATLLLGTAGGVYRTEDSGATWQRAELHPAAYGSLPPAFDPDDESRLWLATDRAGVFESVDAGRTWRPLPGLAGGLPIRDLWFDGAAGTLWAATPAGLFARSRPPRGACMESEIAHCLAGGRFRVEARFAAGSSGAEGVAMASPITADTGAFWFFDPDNLELVVKVLEGCAINDAWWVFATGLTDVEVELVVTDSASGMERRYFAPSGSAFAPRFDTAAFPCG